MRSTFGNRFNLEAPFDLSFWQQAQIMPQLESGCLCRLLYHEESDLTVVNRLRFITGQRFELTRTSGTDVQKGLAKLATILKAETNSVALPDDDTKDVTVPDTVIELVDQLIRRASREGASDIHFEPFEDTLRVRFRLHGTLRNVEELARGQSRAVISRLKILGGLDIAEHRVPQDGRIRFAQNGSAIDIRLSVLPTDFGEKAVLRILDKSALRLELNSLGMTSDQMNVFKRNLNRSKGIILVTGPTGAGKTTTLYSGLNYLRSPKVNITTIEDPIEYNLEGINQTQIKPQIGLDFAHVLRSVLRQDPNIIMVGEIRDSETLDIAIRSALTGHLVLSTLHTNDSVSTVSRLLDLGAEPGLLADALRLIVAQRLVKTLCPLCKVETQDGGFRATGCKSCAGSGYSGRTALFEFLEVDRQLAQAIESRATASSLWNMVSARGTRLLKDEAERRAVTGVANRQDALREVS